MTARRLYQTQITECEGFRVSHLHREPITVSSEHYDTEDFQSWRNRKPNVFDKMLNRTGYLGRTPHVYYNQPHYNYGEVKYAYILVGRGWPKENIVYENYYLSGRALRTSSGLHGFGCALVRGVFTDAFFEAFDELIEKNPRLFDKTKNAVVDLFAVDQSGGRAGLWEVKRANPEGKHTEPIGKHQRAVLAFTTYLARERRASMLRNPMTTLEVGLVVFLPGRMREDEWDRATDRYCEFVV
jgi:hypothetical protein